MVLQEVDLDLTPAERGAGATYDVDPRSLARLATRAEVRQPGTLERTWSGMPGRGMGGMGMGGFMAGNFTSTIAGVVVGSLIADAFLGDAGYGAGSAEAADASADIGRGERRLRRWGLRVWRRRHVRRLRRWLRGDFGGGDF